MKKFILFICTIGWLLGTNMAQNVSINYIYKIKSATVDRYPAQNFKDKVVVKMPFASDSISNPSVVKNLIGKMVTKVELIYTTFRTDESFDQPELNKARLESLKKIAPEIFESSFIEWKVIAQKGATNIEAAKTYFHGFVITTQSMPTVYEREDEISSIADLVTHKKIPIYDTVFKKKTLTYYLPVSKIKRDKGIKYRKKGIWNREKVVEVKIKKRLKQVGEIDSVFINGDYKTLEAKVKKKAENYVMRIDSTVYTVLNRNKWDQMMLVIDVTGSMGNYTQQVLKWVALETNLKRIKHVVCFNDGDLKANDAKKEGKTGGVYHSDDASLLNITATMMLAMKNGGGGDAPENDVEAILSGMENDPNCKEIILIADNWANMRDYSMIKEIKKPVHVIICGNQYGINTQYLDLARVTGGSVHTVEDDLMNLYKLNEGQEITIGKHVYMIKEGKFILVSQT